MIIDTDVIIWDLRGNERAKKAISENIPFSISVITYMEIIQGMRNKKEMQVFLRQLRSWSVDIVQLDRDISSRAMFYIEEYYLSHSTEIADALIASTAIARNDVLLTGNEKHYRHFPNIQIKKFAA